MNIDVDKIKRWLLMTSYGLLILAVGWLTMIGQRVLNDIQSSLCDQLVLDTAYQVLEIAEQGDPTDERSQFVFDSVSSIVGAIEEECDIKILDELNPPSEVMVVLEEFREDS